ncbi:MAG TPA: flagellar filament capping protein FliD [Candidatus Baltobacteraceae bacterium]|jgi:flagellar hook-associated protein 2
MAGSVPGSSTPPISFPGIASGIDYNSIIQKLTSITLAPQAQLNAQVATLNAGNLELIKINGLLASVQDALTALSQPNIYAAFSATSSATNVATAASIPGGSPTQGTYVIQSTQTASSTQVVSDTAVGHSERDLIGSPAAGSDTVPLAQSYAAITPTNGSGSGGGQITINGVSVKYDVNTQSIDTILANIQAQVRAGSGDASFTIGFAGATDKVSITDGAHPIALGAANDSGNLTDVLRLTQAQITNTGTSGSVTGTAGVGGINQAANFNSASNAGFVTPVTSGTFTINGVQITVDTSQDNLSNVITRINSSAAGVTASYNAATGQITLSNKNSGPQSIVLGAGGDSSNFLSASGLVGGAAQTIVGSQSKVVVQQPNGATQTVYSNSNTVTTAIPGIQINLLSSGNTPFEITVGPDNSQVVNALTSFVSAYNATIGEINTATAAPIVVSSQNKQLPGTPAQQYAGGVLWNNSDIKSVKDQLVSYVSGLFQGAAGKRISLSSIGVQLDSTFTQVTVNAQSTTSPVGSQQLNGTDGELQPLDTTQLAAALQADPSSVQSLFNGKQGFVSQLGSYLTGVTGLPTNVSSGLLGNIPRVSVIQGFENVNSAQIQSIQEQIQQIQASATAQGDALRAQFVNTETQLAGYQSLQQQLTSFFKGN